MPSGLVWIANHFVTSGFYVLAAVRVAFGLILISVAAASRAPKELRGAFVAYACAPVRRSAYKRVQLVALPRKSDSAQESRSTGGPVGGSVEVRQ